MRIGRQALAGLLAVPLLLPVPALAIQSSALKAKPKVTAKQAGTSATTIIQHQNAERRTFVSFSRATRSQFRGAGPLLTASTNRYLQDLFKELKNHWKVETRTGVVSPFNFPDL